MTSRDVLERCSLPFVRGELLVALAPQLEAPPFFTYAAHMSCEPCSSKHGTRTRSSRPERKRRVLSNKKRRGAALFRLLPGHRPGEGVWSVSERFTA